MQITEVAVDRDLSTCRAPDWDPSGAVRGADADGIVPVGGLELVVRWESLGSGRRVALRVRNSGRAAVGLAAVRLRLDVRPAHVLEHGYQSWSPVERRPVTSVRRRHRWTPRWARGMYHAAPWLAGRAVTADQFAVLRGDAGGDSHSGVAGFLDGQRNLSTFVTGAGGVWAAAWLDGVVLPPGGERELDPLWLASGDPGLLYAEYAAHWGDEAGARTQTISRPGWCSWYQYFWKVTPEHIRANLDVAKGNGLTFVQIDDGYQRAVGDWLQPSSTWSSGDPERLGEIGALATEIGAAGLEPGIWTAPFVATAKSTLMARHRDWFVRDHRGHPLRAMWNPVSWGGWAFALDTTRPDVIDHLQATYARLTDLGYRYHKIDFCYAAAMMGRRRGDGTVTRAEALRAGLQAVRQGVGDAHLLGCGCPLAQAVGIVDAMRVSPDTAPRWTPALTRVPGYSESAPAARNAVRASVLRAPLHRRLWANDPDCLLLRPRRTRLSAAERTVVTEVIAGIGGVFVLSDDLALYGRREWEVCDRLLHSRAADRPLVLREPFARVAEIVSRRGRLEVCWSKRAPSARWISAPERPGQSL